MKKLIAILIAILIPTVSFALDLSVMDDVELQALIVQINNEIISRSESKTEKILEGYAGKHYVSIDALRLSKDGDDNDVVVFDMTFTNGGEQSEAAFTALNVVVYQNGTEISRGYYIQDANTSNATKKLRPGATISFSYGFVLNNLIDPIEIELEESWNFSEEILYGMFDLPK